MSEKIARISRPQSWRHAFIREHDYRCHYCNRFAGSVEVGPDAKPWHVEHMNALAAGGEDAEENLTLACERCNSLKRTFPYESFRRYARSLFWVGEQERLDLKDLEHLEGFYLKTSGHDWMHHEVDTDQSVRRLIAVTRGDPDLGAAEVIGDIQWTSGRSGGWNNLDFVVEAHRLMSQLIAEIHILHAELALARGDSQATTDAA